MNVNICPTTFVTKKSTFCSEFALVDLRFFLLSAIK